MVVKGPDNTGGSKPMPIEARLGNHRERLRGMTVVERAWREKWVKDQELAPNEPVKVPELRKELINPIRRFYQKPLDVVERSLVPFMGEFRAAVARFTVSKLLMGISILYIAHYHLKYNHKDWTRSGGWAVILTRPRSVPNDPDYPRLSDRNQPWDYYDQGFKSRKVFLD